MFDIMASDVPDCLYGKCLPSNFDLVTFHSLLDGSANITNTDIDSRGLHH
jgi:hypothetical protein